MIARNIIPSLVIGSLVLLMLLFVGCSSENDATSSTDSTTSQEQRSDTNPAEEKAKPLGPGKFSETGK